MSELAQSLYDWLYRSLSLRTAGLAVGLLLVATHAYAFFNYRGLRVTLKEAPRNKRLGTILLSIALVWALLLVSSMDMGEFHRVRRIALILLPVTFGLVLAYVDEFLTARALGILLLLAASPVLDAAFLEAPRTRLLLPILAYVWIIFGMFWVGMPYLFRDHVGWATATEGRWKKLALGGLGYGVLVLVCSIAFWGGA
ncbi:MAG: hypothetical protein ACKV19_25005 [Verrucomicrobiales bacterium]